MNNIFFFLLFFVVGSLAMATDASFKGDIDLESKVSVTVHFSTPTPVVGTFVDQSHIVETSSKKSAICEYHYTFALPQVMITVANDAGVALGTAASDATATGVIYTDSPATADLSQCQPPASTQFPVSGPLDISLGAIKNFQLGNNLLLSIEPAKKTFNNQAAIDLKDKNVQTPELTGLILDSMEKMKWSTFGDNITAKTGTLSLDPVKP